MKFSVMTLFPEMIETVMGTSILGRATQKGAFKVQTYQIRDFAEGKYKKVDDSLCGGGKGMLMLPEPLWQCFQKVSEDIGSSQKVRKIYLSPKGKVFHQEMAKSLAKEEHIVLLCGHYEGVDQRFLELAEFEEVSMGDFVLTGGELPALVLMDAVARMLPEVLSEEATRLESHMSLCLEAKQYTKPADWRGKKVPEVLLSGHHANIERYRYLSSLAETKLKRPDLFEKIELSAKDKKLLEEFILSENEA